MLLSPEVYPLPKLNERMLAEVILKRTMGRCNFNRLGYAVQLNIFKHLGYALATGEQPPDEILEFLKGCRATTSQGGHVARDLQNHSRRITAWSARR